MSTQPEALRLADVICDYSRYGNESEQVAKLRRMKANAEAAAELRRLHAECNDLAHQLKESNERNGRLIAQRDALLEALKRMASIIDKMGDMPDGFIHPSPWQTLKCDEALTQARAAIRAVEGEKT
jgi:hypothetical protein